MAAKGLSSRRVELLLSAVETSSGFAALPVPEKANAVQSHLSFI